MVLSSLASVSSGSHLAAAAVPDIVRAGLAVYFDAANPDCYDFAVNPTTLNDLSGNERNGTLNSTGGISSSKPAVTVDGLVSIQSISGNAHYVSTTYAPVIEVPSTEYTFEIWFRDNDSFKIFHTSATTTTLISNFPAGASAGALLHISGQATSSTDPASTGGLLAAERTSSATDAPPNLVQKGLAATTFEINKWYHIVMSANTTEIQIYINGVPIEAPFPRRQDVGFKASTVPANTMRFGGGFQNRGQTCLLGPMRVYMGKALNADEVKSNYDAEQMRFPNAA